MGFPDICEDTSNLYPSGAKNLLNSDKVSATCFSLDRTTGSSEANRKHGVRRPVRAKPLHNANPYKDHLVLVKLHLELL